MSKTARTRMLAISALLITNVIWAAAAPVAKKAFNEGISPALFLQFRFILASIVILPIIAYLYKAKKFGQYLNARTTITILILEFFGTFLALFLFYAGVQKTSAIDATLLTASMPLFVTLGGIIFLKEKETGFELFGLLIAFIGNIILIFNGGGLSLNVSNPGNLLIFGHNLVIAAYYLLAKKYYKKINKIYISGLGFVLGAVFFSLVAIPNPTEAITAAMTLGPWSAFAVAYMAILGSVVALTLYLYGQDKIEASEAIIFTYLSPLFTIPLSYVMLGETIGQKELVAGTLILLGVIIAQKRKK